MSLDTEGKIQSLVERVRSIYPDMNVESAEWVGSGQNNDVIVLNHSFIFRFPHHEVAAVNLSNEVILLQSLQNRLPLAIPNPTYVHLNPEDLSRSFMGYRRLEGTVLTRQHAQSLGEVELAEMAQHLEAFLHALHTCPVSSDVREVIPVTSTYEDWSDMYGRMERLLFPHMRPDARAQVRAHFEPFLAAAKDFNEVLIHGDFGAANILVVHENTTKVVAVIDFGSVRVGDPAIDYASVSTIHPRMLDLMAKQNPRVEEYTQRITFYKGTFALQEALYGAEAGDKGAFDRGMVDYV